jgi:hypothetical protein
MVDELLDVLTGGEHSKTVAALPARQKPVPVPVEIQLVSELCLCSYTETSNSFCRKSGPEPKLAKVDIDVNSLKGLADLGIDMGFLDSLGMTTSKKRYSLNFGAYSIRNPNRAIKTSHTDGRRGAGIIRSDLAIDWPTPKGSTRKTLSTASCPSSTFTGTIGK